MCSGNQIYGISGELLQNFQIADLLCIFYGTAVQIQSKNLALQRLRHSLSLSGEIIKVCK